jgi:nucleotide-binding universal stress UspA family protein
MNAFDSILVPIDFSINTEVAVGKAMQLATPGSTVLYLLHIEQSNIFSSVVKSSFQKHNEAEKKLFAWKEHIGKLHPQLEVITKAAEYDNIEWGIISFARELKASLVIVGKKSRHSLFPFLNTVISSNISEASGCPVLTVKPGLKENGVSTIVMPVTEFFPARKMDVLSALNTRTTMQIHLLSILNEDEVTTDYTASALLLCMRAIRTRFKCSVQHMLIHNNNKAMAALRYAEQINADMLLLNPETETTINTWISKKDITDVLKPTSKLQVLSVQPYLND